MSSVWIISKNVLSTLKLCSKGPTPNFGLSGCPIPVLLEDCLRVVFPANPCVSYLVQIYCPGGVVSVPELTQHYECEGLGADTGYEFAVSAVNEAGVGENATVSGNTTCSPSPPSVEDRVINQQSSCTVK